MHMERVARKEWIEREKESEKVEFPFKKRRGEGNIGERGKGKINLLELIFSPKSSLWLNSGKKKRGKSIFMAKKWKEKRRENQYFFPFSFPLFRHKEDLRGKT